MAKRIPPSILKGILSLLGNKVPKWLTNLINKTKGADEYVEGLKKDVDIMGEQTSNLMEKHPFLTEDEEFMKLEKLKQLQIEKFKEAIGYDDFLKKNDETLKEAVDKLKDSEKMATSMEEEVKSMIDQVEDLNQKMKLLNPDDDDPTYHAKGGIKFDKGLWQSLMSLGKSMGISPKEQLKTFIEIGIPIPDKLKQKWGITEADLEFKEPAEGLEWLILKNNPDLAKQPYSESKINKMLSDEFEEIDKVPIQGDLFEKKNGGLISLVR